MITTIHSIIKRAKKDHKLTVEILTEIKREKDHKFRVEIGKILGQFIDKEVFTNSFKSFLIDNLVSDSEKKIILATALFNVLKQQNPT